MHNGMKIGPYSFSKPILNGRNYERKLRYYALPKILNLSGYTFLFQDGALLLGYLFGMVFGYKVFPESDWE